MEMFDLVTIIVPIYNMELYLKECLDSIVKQSYSHLEILLINDGSTDRSLKICNEYQKKDKRIKVISKENGGLSSAKNMGLASANGKYIAFVDADDYVEPNFIEVLYKNIKLTASSLSICGYYKTYPEKEIKIVGSDFIVNGTEKYVLLFSKYQSQTVASWNKLYDKSIFASLKFPDGINHEDTYLIPDILYNAKKVSYIMSECLYHYRQRGDSICHVYDIKSLNRIDAFIHMKEFFGKKNIKYDETKLNLIIFSELRYILWKIPYGSLSKNEIVIYKKYQQLFSEYKHVVWKCEFSLYQRIKLMFSFIMPNTFMFLKDIRRKN